MTEFVRYSIFPRFKRSQILERQQKSVIASNKGLTWSNLVTFPCPFSRLEGSDMAKESQEAIIQLSLSPSQIHMFLYKKYYFLKRRFCVKTGEVLTLRSFKTRAKSKAKNTKEFCKITTPITSLGDRIYSQNCHQESVIL